MSSIVFSNDHSAPNIEFIDGRVNTEADFTIDDQTIGRRNFAAGEGRTYCHTAFNVQLVHRCIGSNA